MEKLDEKIYKLLENKKRSMSMIEIVEGIEGVSKIEVTKKLLEMNRQGIVYKKINEGKAYYSIKPEDGEGRNASQENINNISRAFSSTNTLNNKEIIKKADEIFGVNASPNLLEDVEIMNKLKLNFANIDTKDFKYNKNIYFENDSYKMAMH